MSKRTKTISKNFFDDEIKGVYYEEDKKIIYLKDDTHRTYNPYLLDYDRVTHRNTTLDIVEKYRKVYIKLYGEGDFSNNESFD